MKFGCAFWVLLVVFFGCKRDVETNLVVEPPRVKESINPNGDSELALLMRSMTDYMERTKDSLEQGRGVSDCPETFKRLTKASETEGMIKDRDHFNAYAEQWLSDLNLVCGKKGEEQIQAYERLRTSCLNCHQSYCQGPIPKIQRLTIQKP
jgi:hypothetical protein